MSKVPDKVYLDIIEDDDTHMISLSFENNGGVEYIRKDALLEWAKDMNECGATLLAVDTLIDKLNSM